MPSTSAHLSTAPATLCTCFPPDALRHAQESMCGRISSRASRVIATLGSLMTPPPPAPHLLHPMPRCRRGHLVRVLPALHRVLPIPHKVLPTRQQSRQHRPRLPHRRLHRPRPCHHLRHLALPLCRPCHRLRCTPQLTRLPTIHVLAILSASIPGVSGATHHRLD